MPGANLISSGRTSFGDGAGDVNLGGFSTRSLVGSARARLLDRRGSYFECSQHDFKQFDFEGRVISGAVGIGATQPLISGELTSFHVPLRSRRPSSPYRLAKAVVSAFTSMVFGEDKFPIFRCEGDDSTEDFTAALVKATKLPSKMIRARNLGGSQGSVGLSWRYEQGKPRVKVHNAKSCFVREWEDREECIPRHVMEIYQYTGQEEWDDRARRFVHRVYWHRRDWTPNADVMFKPALVVPGEDPNWEPDVERSFQHDDRLIHFVWIQNQECDDVDGIPDYEGEYESFDALDMLLSVILRGATLNLDPTLVLKVDQMFVSAVGVKKGSDHALTVGEKGDAAYLELTGTSIDAGVKLFNTKRATILETVECVLLDPNEAVAQGTSSVAQKMAYKPMLGKVGLIREQYAAGMSRLLESMVAVARAASKSTITIFDDEGNAIQAKQEVKLPPRFEKEPVTGEDGMPTGEETSKAIERVPGEGEELEADWPELFPPTPTDQAGTIMMLSTATGQQPFLSKRTATEIAMEALGRPAGDEVQRVVDEAGQVAAQQAKVFSDASDDAGGKVTHTAQIPGGGTLRRSSGGPPPKSSSSEDPLEDKSKEDDDKEEK